MRLRDISEGELLARLFPLYAGTRPALRASVPVGPGDDAAVVGAPGGSVVATTDSMVRGLDWRDEWSSAHDVGAKVAAQNLADIAAMGALPTALLVSLVADPDLEVAWAVELARGVASVAEQAGAPVVGGDLSSAPAGVVVVSVTALGDLGGLAPVLRSGARVGDVVAVCGSLGLSGGGLVLYGRGEADPDAVRGGARRGAQAGAQVVEPARRPFTRRPCPHAPPSGARAVPWGCGPVAAAAGAHALVDVSDGLVTDLGRVAAASGVSVDLHGSVLLERYAAGPLTMALGPDEALHQVLAGGEEHSLVGAFADAAALPAGDEPWRVIGRVVEPGPEGPSVTVDGLVPDARGWDHFAR